MNADGRLSHALPNYKVKVQILAWGCTGQKLKISLQISFRDAEAFVNNAHIYSASRVLYTSIKEGIIFVKSML